MLTTGEFGKRWGSLSSEKKLKLSSASVKSPSDFMEVMKTSFNFHCIEIIGMRKGGREGYIVEISEVFYTWYTKVLHITLYGN